MNRSEEKPYTFSEIVPPKESIVHNITEYAIDPALGQDIGATALIKWNNQTHHDDYLRSLLSGGWDASRGLSNAPNNRARSRYYDGYVARIDLGAQVLDASNAGLVDMLQPTGYDICGDGTEVYASANRLLIRPLGAKLLEKTIEHPLFARLHSAEFNHDSSRVLTASSALDLIYEVDIESGRPAWMMDIWTETPFDTNAFGQKLYRQAPERVVGGRLLHNPDPLFMKDNEHTRGALCVIDNPDRYKGLGLPTALMPAFINSVSYGVNNDILATSYQRGEGWVIDREARNIKAAIQGMKRPHGLHLDPLLEDGMMVTDTVGERVIYKNGDYTRELIVDFSRLDGMKPGLEKAGWLQYTTRIAPNTYCAVLTSRQRLVLFDPVAQTYREISIDPEWGVQMVAAAIDQPSL